MEMELQSLEEAKAQRQERADARAKKSAAAKEAEDAKVEELHEATTKLLRTRYGSAGDRAADSSAAVSGSSSSAVIGFEDTKSNGAPNTSDAASSTVLARAGLEEEQKAEV